MSDPLTAWTAPVDDRIGLIAKKLGEVAFAKDVPGLKDVLDDYLNPDTETTKVDFHRGLLSTFKRSEVDNTYQDLLAKYTQDEQDRLEKFVDGKPPAETCKGFIMGPSLGAREEMEALHGAEKVDVSAAGPVHVDGLSSGELKKKDSGFHKFVTMLAEFFHLHKEKDSVTVGLSNPCEEV